MKKEIIAGIVLDEQATFNLSDICRLCNISAELVIDMIDEGVVFPSGSDPLNWKFCGVDVKRAQIALRLQHDLRINLPGVALALELLDELESLRQR